MKDLGLLIWVTQLGISVAAPLVGYILIAVWLQHRFELGAWIVVVGAVLGTAGAVRGLKDALKSMDKYIKRKKKDAAPPPVGFSEHD